MKMIDPLPPEEESDTCRGCGVQFPVSQLVYGPDPDIAEGLRIVPLCKACRHERLIRPRG